MSEHRTESTTAGTLLVLFLLLGGLALLGLIVVVGLGFVVSRTTGHREILAMEAERADAMQQRMMAELMAAQARDAEMARRRKEFNDVEELGPPGQQPKPLDPAQLQQALDVANQYLAHMKAKRFKEAEGLFSADYLAQPNRLPLAEGDLPKASPVLTGVRASAQAFRFRYHASTPEMPLANWFLSVVPTTEGFRISAIELDDGGMAGGSGGPGGGPP